MPRIEVPAPPQKSASRHFRSRLATTHPESSDHFSHRWNPVTDTQSLTSLTILPICEKLSPFASQGHSVANGPGGGSGVGNLVAYCRGRNRRPSRRGSIVRCPLFRTAS